MLATWLLSVQEARRTSDLSAMIKSDDDRPMYLWEATVKTPNNQLASNNFNNPLYLYITYQN